jgi:hypothetical protein
MAVAVRVFRFRNIKDPEENERGLDILFSYSHLQKPHVGKEYLTQVWDRYITAVSVLINIIPD